MPSRDQIRALAFTVNDGLTAYIAVHNGIFKEAATLKSFFKNLVGMGAPMSVLFEEAKALVPIWEDINQKVETFRFTNYTALSADERRYFDILAHYVTALRRTAYALVDRQRLMNEGSKGGSDNPMTWPAYRQLQQAYQEAIDKYTAIGRELNAAANAIF